jgi:hypothetical protein
MGALAGFEVEYVEQGEVVLDGVVPVAELARGRVGIASADELPESVIGVVAAIQNRLCPIEDLAERFLDLVRPRAVYATPRGSSPVVAVHR